MQGMPRKGAKILAIIPARGGSAGIPRKNIRPFSGKPLIVHTIEAAKNSPSVERIVVSTDSEEIASVALDYGAEVPFLRPPELATNESSIVDAVIHLVASLKEREQYQPSHILLLQPTSPLRTSEDIEKAVRLFFDSNADSLVSICRTENLLMTKADDDTISVTNREMLRSPNRQELPRYYKLDGSMLYLVKTDVFLRERSFLSGKLVGYEIPRWRAVDIDEPQDFIVGERIFKAQNEIEREIRDFS